MIRGNISNLRVLAKQLKALPVTVAQSVAAAAAPKLTTLARTAYASGTTVYGDPRPLGIHGNDLDLVDTGFTSGRIGFVSIGTQVKCNLGKPYTRFLIGKYRILPNGPLPVAWAAEISRVVDGIIKKELRA